MNQYASTDPNRIRISIPAVYDQDGNLIITARECETEIENVHYAEEYLCAVEETHLHRTNFSLNDLRSLVERVIQLEDNLFETTNALSKLQESIVNSPKLNPEDDKAYMLWKLKKEYRDQYEQ